MISNFCMSYSHDLTSHTPLFSSLFSKPTVPNCHLLLHPQTSRHVFFSPTFVAISSTSFLPLSFSPSLKFSLVKLSGSADMMDICIQSDRDTHAHPPFLSPSKNPRTNRTTDDDFTTYTSIRTSCVSLWRRGHFCSF